MKRKGKSDIIVSNNVSKSDIIVSNNVSKSDIIVSNNVSNNFKNEEKEMIHEKIFFSNKFSDVYMESYIHGAHDELQITARKTIIVCPGGGYWFLSEREAEPVALRYFAAGLNVFILRYSVQEMARDHAPQIQAAEAIKYLREHSDELHIDPSCVCITGFSAGGHLSACASVMWKLPEIYTSLGFESPADICRPTAAVLCYPVISSTPEGIHRGCFEMLCPDAPEDHEKFSVETLVDSDTSPAFIWHTARDTCVPVANSLLYASALSKNGVSFELHIYPKHDHGLSLCNRETWSQNIHLLYPHAESWIDQAIDWILNEEYK